MNSNGNVSGRKRRAVDMELLGTVNEAKKLLKEIQEKKQSAEEDRKVGLPDLLDALSDEDESEESSENDESIDLEEESEEDEDEEEEMEMPVEDEDDSDEEEEDEEDEMELSGEEEDDSDEEEEDEVELPVEEEDDSDAEEEDEDREDLVVEIDDLEDFLEDEEPNGRKFDDDVQGRERC